MHIPTRGRLPNLGRRILPKNVEKFTDLELLEHFGDREGQVNSNSTNVSKICRYEIFQANRERLYVREVAFSELEEES